MERGFEIDGIKFTPTSLAGHPTHAALLATIFTSFSLTEGAIGGIYGLLKHQDYAVAIEELKALGSNAKRTEAVRSLIKTALPAAEAVPLEALMKRVLAYAPARNKIAHGIWGAHPDKPDELYRLPVKQWITFLASMVPNRADASDIIDELNEHMEAYGLNDLQAVASEGEKLLEDLILAFTGLAGRAAQVD